MIVFTRTLSHFSSEKKILKFIKTASSPQEIYQIYHKNSENFTPFLILETLKQFNTSIIRRKFQEEDQKFFQEVVDVFQQIPMQDKWRFYVQVSKMGKNKQLIKQFGGDLICTKIKQVAILLWGYHKNGIKKPRVVIHLIDQIQQNLDKLTIIPEKTDKNTLFQEKKIEKQEKQQDEDDPTQSEDEDFLEQELQQNFEDPKSMNDFKYKYKDLVLILWAIQDIKLDSNSLIIYTFQTAINNFNNKELISNRSLILLLQATFGNRDSQQIIAYQKLVIQNLSEQDLSNEGTLQLLLLLRTLGKMKQNPEFAIKLAQIILKNQENSNYNFSTKFVSIILWNLNKLGVVNTELYNRLGLHLIKSNEFKGIDVSQAILIYSHQQTKSPEYQQYQFILRSLISKANITKLDARNKDIILQSLTEFQPHLLKLWKQK